MDLTSDYGSHGGSDGKKKKIACNAGDPGLIPGSGKSFMEKEIATDCSIRTWKIPWTEEASEL